MAEHHDVAPVVADETAGAGDQRFFQHGSAVGKILNVGFHAGDAPGRGHQAVDVVERRKIIEKPRVFGERRKTVTPERREIELFADQTGIPADLGSDLFVEQSEDFGDPAVAEFPVTQGVSRHDVGSFHGEDLVRVEMRVRGESAAALVAPAVVVGPWFIVGIKILEAARDLFFVLFDHVAAHRGIRLRHRGEAVDLARFAFVLRGFAVAFGIEHEVLFRDRDALRLELFNGRTHGRVEHLHHHRGQNSALTCFAGSACSGRM